MPPSVLKIDIIADASKAISGMKDASDAAGGIGSSVKSAAKIAGGVLGGAAIVGFGKASVDAANESAVANARLEAIFASMGDSGGQAAKAAEDYASALSKKTGVEDESIMAGQAQLATFGEVSSESARMAGIFDRATSAGADLAAAGFGSIESNAVQLGKALQDPTKGMTALAKSGVTFTDAQKEQIKALQESGDLLGAQKIVLGAVEQQVGGTAAATVTSQQKANLAFGELQETIGNKLLPVVNTAMDLFTKYSDIIIPVAGAIAALVIGVKAYELAQVVASAATAAWTIIQTAFNIIMSANPIMIVILAIAGLVAAIIIAYNKVGWFHDIIDALWQGIQVAFNAILDIVKGVFNWISDHWPLLLAIITGPIGIAILLITKNFDTLRDAAMAVVNWVMDRFQDLVGFISRIVQTFTSIFGSIVDAIKLPIQAATDVYNWVTGKIQGIADFISNIIGTVRGYAESMANAIKGPINTVIRAWNAIQFEVPSVDVGPVHFGGQTIGMPDIPTLATGGMVLRTGLALVHEGEQFSGVGKSMGGQTVNITVHTTGLGADAPSIQRAVVEALRGHTARNGPLPFPVSSRTG